MTQSAVSPQFLNPLALDHPELFGNVYYTHASLTFISLNTDWISPSMWELDNGIRVRCSPGVCMVGPHRSDAVSITAPPAFKDWFCTRTGTELLQEIRANLRSLRKLPRSWRVYDEGVVNRSVRVMAERTGDDVPGTSSEATRAIVCLLVKRSMVWEQGHCWEDWKRRPIQPPQTGCPGLQQLLLRKLEEDTVFKVESCIHHTSLRGADSTLHLLALAHEWSGSI